jgi:hypothetical protein
LRVDAAGQFPNDITEREVFGFVTTHELTHSLLDASGDFGFDAGEHVLDPDQSDPPEGPNDVPYLMATRSEHWQPEQVTQIIYEDRTRSRVDLTSKESVERTP